MGYITNLNAVYNTLYNIIVSAGIKNLRNFDVKLCKKGIPAKLSTTACPVVAIFKTNAEGNEIGTDQEDVELPNNLKVTIGIVDFSQVSLDDAERYTDDLIDKLIVVLQSNPGLSNTAKGILITRIAFDWEPVDNPWFSTPSMELEIICRELD